MHVFIFLDISHTTKNIYRYVITDKELDVEYKTHFPELAGTIFKWLAGTFIIATFIFIA